MSWHIHCVKNTVIIDVAVAKSIYGCPAREEYEWSSIHDVLDGIHLAFNPDHMEHMDFVENPVVQRILKKAKARGDICFTSNEGDDAGCSWGYRFDGKGGMLKLVGHLVFDVEGRKVPTKTTRKPSKKSPKAKKPVTVLECQPCAGDPAGPQHDESVPRGRNLTKAGFHRLYCYDCGEHSGLKRVKV